MMAKYIHDIKVLGLEKIRKEMAGKRYEFVLNVKWSNNSEATIYRPHSMFFDFQAVLSEMFKNEKIPSVPAAKFHWILLGKLGHEKECKSMEEFCLKIIRLPPVVSQASIVLHFFETWGTDLRTNQKASELFDPAVGRAVIVSTEERVKSISTLNDEKEDKYKVVANYQATNIGEISLNEGEEVTIIEQNERGWWFIADESGRQGWAPATYLEPIAETNDDAGYNWICVKDTNGNGEIYISTVAFTAQNADEVSYNANNEVEVLEKSNYGWWRVRINNKIGITPATNLQRINEKCLYSSADELQTRTVSISSASGLYAVIRKPPPRRESVRSRSSSGISQLPSPQTSFKENGLTGKKPSRFVYSAASFAGGKFVIGEDDKENDTPTSPEPEIKHGDNFSVSCGEAYINLDADYKNSMPVIKPPIRSSSLDESAPAIRLNHHQPIINSSYYNQQITKPGDSLREEIAHNMLIDLWQTPSRRSRHCDIEFYSALLDYTPSANHKDGLCLNKGDLVQLISCDSGWMCVMKMTGELERQGWVPENYLERKFDVDIREFAAKEERKPKPRPRPLPRPKQKAQEPNNNQPRPLRTLPEPAKRGSVPDVNYRPPDPTMSRPSLPDIRVDRSSLASSLPSVNKDNVAKRMATRPPMPVPLLNDIRKIRMVTDLYDEPETKLRSVYDAEPWFYGKISRTECERILSTYGRQKEFLIRESNRAVGSYALSVKYCYRIRHFGIELTEDKTLLIGSKKFPNLLEIVDYYQKNALFYSEHNDHITIGLPFLRERLPK